MLKSTKYYLLTFLFMFFPTFEFAGGQMTFGHILSTSGMLGLAITALIIGILFFAADILLNYVPGIKDNAELAKLKPIIGTTAFIVAIFELICVFVAWSKAPGLGLSFSGVCFIVIMFAWIGSTVLSTLRGMGVKIPTIKDLLKGNK